MIQLYTCQKQQDISHPQFCLLVIKLPVKDNKDGALALIKDWIIPAPFNFNALLKRIRKIRRCQLLKLKNWKAEYSDLSKRRLFPYEGI